MRHMIVPILLSALAIAACKTSQKADETAVKSEATAAAAGAAAAASPGGCTAPTLTSEVRRECVWAKVTGSNYGRENMPDLTLPGAKDAAAIALPALNTRSFAGGEEINRGKAIHRYGVVAKVKFVAVPETNHGYTGIFKTGSDLGLVRLSLAVKPSEFMHEKSHLDDDSQEFLDLARAELARAKREAALQTPLVNNFTPGMALKIYVPNRTDGRSADSVNMHVMYSVDGHDSFNFFAENFSNVLPNAHSLKAKLGAHFFKEGMQYIGAKDSYPGNLAVDHFAAVDAKGNQVSASKAPYKILFQPHPEMAGTYRNLMKEEEAKFFSRAGFKEVNVDFRRIFTDSPFAYKVGQVLFTVWGKNKVVAQEEASTNEDREPVANPSAEGFTKIGTLVLASPFVASTYGDETLHFAHHTK